MREWLVMRTEALVLQLQQLNLVVENGFESTFSDVYAQYFRLA